MTDHPHQTHQAHHPQHARHPDSTVPAVPTIPDPRAVLAECKERVLEREGIPMYLGFEFDDAGTVAVTDQTALAEGALLAPLVGHYRAQLSPDAGDGDEPALIDVLQVMAIAHLDLDLDLGGAR